MKKRSLNFLRNTIKFVSIFSGCILLLIVFSNYILTNKEGSFKVDANAENLIIGHSHSEYAYSDHLIENTINLSQSGDAYFYTYLKVKQVLKSNPQIKTVLIEFSNNQIDLKMNDWTWDAIHLDAKFTKLSAFAGIKDYSVLLRNNPNDVFKSLSIGLRKNIEMSIKTPSHIIEEKDWGGFQKTEKNRIDSILKRQQINKPQEEGLYEISDINIKYLENIIAYCNTKNVTPFLIRTPVHESYHYLDNDKQFDSIRDLHFKSISFLDFKRYPILNSQFADDSHLNFKGATELSSELHSLIKNGLLQSENPQQKIEDLITNKIFERSHFYKMNYGYDLSYSNTKN